MLRLMRLAMTVVSVACLLGPPAAGADWPQLQNGPQRLGYSPENIDVPLKNVWAYGFSPERVFPQAQPVVAGGRLFIGTAMGSFKAFDANNGSKLWWFPAGGPILHTAGVENDRAFFGCLDGCVYALDVANGEQAWRFDSGLRTGFSTAVLLAEGKVFIANRKGVYYALSQQEGAQVWRRDIGVPILMSSAYENGRVFFGAMDMRVYALDAKTGEILWRSDVLYGAAFKDYWPVAYQGYVFIRPTPVSGGAWGPAVEWLKGLLPEQYLTQQEAQIKAFEDNPTTKNLFVLDQKTGKEPFTVPHWITQTMNGAPTPPCVDGDGLLIIPVTLHDWRGGWGRLDMSKRRVVEVLCDGDTAYLQQRGYMRGSGNSDENLNVSAAGRLVLTFHTEEGNANFTGVWHLDRHEWVQLPPYQAEQYFVSNTQGGGGNAPSIAEGMIYHTTWNTLNCRAAMPAP